MTKYLYIIFIGILFAVLVGVGIAAFYPEPKYPEYPIELNTTVPQKEGSTESAKMETKRVDYEKKSRAFQKVNEDYNRNVSIIAMTFAVLFVLLGLLFARSVPIFPDGLLLGSVGTLVYSIVRGFGAHDDMYRFFIVAVSLFISLVIGYVKFIKPQSSAGKK
jgi:hypothetical protein